MRFDVIIGNPPYQEELKNTSDRPIYNEFMSESYKIADKVCLITPGRFLFNAGKTPKAWNRQMLNDKSLKVIHYEEDSSKYFANIDIKGGVAITYRDRQKDFGAIGTFTQFPELSRILTKVTKSSDFLSIGDLIYGPLRFDLEKVYADNPHYKEIVGSNGRERRLTTPIFTQLDFFEKNKKSDDLIEVLGLIRNRRTIRYINKKYIEEHPNLESYKVLLPKANGTGKFGEALSTPLVSKPFAGGTHSFISIGNFKSLTEAESALKYIKSKFARAMLGILKVTQDNLKSSWGKVPTQDFTDKSDIDWTKSISDIDQQLYKKYTLSQEEIEFIELNVREME